MDQELEKFKSDIDLCAFAASRGYERDARESSQNCEVMRNSNGDKIVVVKRDDKHTGKEIWVYCCPHDERDRGDIISFLKWRNGGNLGQIRKTLRPWIGATPPEVPSYNRPHKLRPVTRDREAVLIAWEKAKPTTSLAYLMARGLRPDLLALPIFEGCLRVDPRGNALFPHFDRDGLCGFEVKNYGFTGFSAGGQKGLWFSKPSPEDRALAFCESAIDALSFFVLHPGEKLRLMSVGGALNPDQPALIRGAMEKMPEGSAVLLAFDDDEGGEKLADQVRELAPPSVKVRRAAPPIGSGKDWNEALKLERGLGDAFAPTVTPAHGKTPPAEVLQKQFPKGSPLRGPRLGNRGRNRR